ncbi:MAG TPA: hypothetical protein VHJ78_04895 [Actinomycetota bacterium]|nr:hypothetical protein [Actinomycetota bacterium]
MKVAVAAAVLAAFVLGLSVSGVLGQPPAAPPADAIELRSDGASPSPSPASSGRPEWVDREVEYNELDDKGGLRRDAERGRVDSSGPGSGEVEIPEPDEVETPREDDRDGTRSENSGSGSSNSGSGSSNSGRDDGD